MAGLGRVVNFSSGERMTIGLQNVTAPAAGTGLGGIGIDAAGMQAAPEAPSASPIQPDQNIPDTWLKSDLQAPLYITPWGEFNIGATDWASNLHGAYDKTKAASATIHSSPLNGIGSQYFNEQIRQTNPNHVGMTNAKMGIGPDNWVYTPTSIDNAQYTGSSIFGDTFSGTAKRAPIQTNLSFKDPNQQRYIEDFSTIAPNGNVAKAGTGSIINRADASNIAALNKDNIGADQAQAIADKYGVSVDEVQNVFNKYNRARQDIIDPVGASWQNIKAAPFYKDLEAGIQKYTNDGLATKIDFAGLHNINPTAALSPEYFALHDPKDSPGRDPYRLTTAYDFLNNGKPWEQATPEEQAAAQAAYLHHKEQLSAPASEGGPFNYRDEYIRAGGPTSLKGYNFNPEGYSKNNYDEALNINQNYLQHATDGKMNYHDVGFDDDTATQSLFTKKKKKRGFLGGVLGPLTAIASFIPGPVGIGARVLSAANSAMSGNPLGAITSTLGFLPGVNGTGLNVIGGGAGKLAGTIGSALGGGNIANIAGKAITGGGLGALTGAISGHPLEGAIAGAAAPAIGGTIAANTTISPAVANALGTGIAGVGVSAYNYNKAKRAYNLALQKQQASRSAA